MPCAGTSTAPDGLIVRRTRGHLLLALVLIIGLLPGVAPAVAKDARVDAPTDPAAPEVPETPEATGRAPEPPEVSARGAVLWDPADDLVLHGVEEELPRPMASTTKIMTTLLALEAGTSSDVVTVSPRAAAIGEASLDLQPGQQLPMRSLLAGLMVRSGNDAASAVAEHVDADEAAFIARMNRRAGELGLVGTRFTSPSGLTGDPGHLATPLDLARLAAHAMADPTFAEFAGAAQLTVPGLAPMVNRNELIGVYPGATGVKTGFTTLAGLCLVASATRDGRTLYAVVLGSTDSFGDVAALLDHGFDDYRRAEPAAADLPVTTYRWADAEVPLLADAALGATVPAHAVVTWRVLPLPSLARPLAAGALAGTGQLLVDGVVRSEIVLRAGEAVPAPEARGAPARAGGAVQDALRTLLRTQAIDRAA